MAGALIKGLLASGTVTADQVRASDTSKERLEALAKQHDIVTTTHNAELVSWANLLVLAVKPQVMDKVLDEVGQAIAEDTLVVSIAAGVPIRSIEARLHEGVRVVRAMPNTAAIVLAGATGIAPGVHATDDDVENARKLFDAVGRTVVLDETLIDAVTGLSGSGPAYVYLFAEALIAGGVAAGLSPALAQELTFQTLLGAGAMLAETGETPQRLREMVTSPGGTTLAGLEELGRRGFIDTVAAAVGAATRRSAELGRG